MSGNRVELGANLRRGIGGVNMAKTAQEWQDLLGLAKLPTKEQLADLNALDGLETIEGGGVPASQWAKTRSPQSAHHEQNG